MPITAKRTSDSVSDRRRSRAELWDSVPAVVLSLAAFTIMLVADPDGLAPLNVLWASLWAASALWFVLVQVRSLGRADEYHRVVRLEALAIGFAAVMVSFIVAGVLNALGIGERRQFFEVAPMVGFLVWVAAHGVKMRRAG